MVCKLALLTPEQTPHETRRFFWRFRDLVGVPQTRAQLTADDTCAWEASSNAPSNANTETSWSYCESNRPRDAQSTRVMVDVNSTTMAASAAPASPLLRGSERATPVLGGVVCGGRRSRVDRTSSAATSHRSVHAGPVGLDSQFSGSGTSTAGAGVQVVRPQYADMGSSPFADTQDQEVTALINKLMQEMDEARAASSQISLERDEALARN